MAQDHLMNRPVPSRPMPVEWVVATYSIPRRTLALLVREGLIEVDPEDPHPTFRPEMIDRIRTILALRKELGVNMAGVEIILRLRQQLLWYRTRHSEPPPGSCIDMEP
jgi:MerR family transcriptional regulator/heat shock protein HspR